MPRKKENYFAFDSPLEKFFSLPEKIYLYWKNPGCTYLGANDDFAHTTGITTQNMPGISNHDFTANTFMANDKKKSAAISLGV